MSLRKNLKILRRYFFFEKENEELKKKNEWLTSSLQKFSNAKKTFDMILVSQKCIFDKNGLAYKPFEN